jgi:hypothetical protein
VARLGGSSAAGGSASTPSASSGIRCASAASATSTSRRTGSCASWMRAPKVSRVTMSKSTGLASSVLPTASRHGWPAGRSSLSMKTAASPNTAFNSRASAVALSTPSLVR